MTIVDERVQFRVLYRQFLFRTVDLELIAPHGDMSKLLGQFAAILVSFGFGMSIGGLFFDGSPLSRPALIAAILGMQHFLISTTMLVVGIFAVLSWDSMFPDKRDVLVLAPLPIRARTLFLAKTAAIATALSVTVIALNFLPSIAWAVHFASIHPHSGLFQLIRAAVAFAVTSFAAGAFVFGSVLALHGLAAQLPRGLFLRASAFLQIGAFGVFLATYLLEPPLGSPQALSDPTYWFLGLMQALNGSIDAAANGSILANRAIIGIAIVSVASAIAFLLSYLRTMRKVVEQPDIVPGARGIGWTPRFGNALQSAVVLFSIRTLLRSRQHRVMLAFYLGIGFAIVILLIKAPHQRDISTQGYGPAMFASVVMMLVWIAGTRIVFSLPLDLRANWIFRVTQVRAVPEYIAASRRPLFVLAVAPVWAMCVAVFFWLWPWRDALRHLIVLGAFGILIAFAALFGFQKIPFTCSYLPGKSQANLAFAASMPLLFLLSRGVVWEMQVLHESTRYYQLLAILCVAALVARWLAIRRSRSEESAVQFEEAAVPAIQILGISNGPIR